MVYRSLFTPTRAVCGLVLLAALVVGGLVWVSVAALRVEAAERQAAARADVSNRERLALWRLDSHMLSPLGVENNRPYQNYLTLAPPAPVVLDHAWNRIDDPGRSPSPLLSVELPPWMLLHVHLDPAIGWGSPQVLSPLVLANFQGDQLELNTDNYTSERIDLLSTLRAQYPVAATIQTLATQDGLDPDTAPYVVPVSLPNEPAVEKPGPYPASADSHGNYRESESYPKEPRPFSGESQSQSEMFSEAQIATARGLRRGSAIGNSAVLGGAALDAMERFQLEVVKMVAEQEEKRAESLPDPKPEPQVVPLPNDAPTIPAPASNSLNAPVQPASKSNPGLPPDAQARKDLTDAARATRGGYQGQIGGRGGQWGQAQAPGGFGGGGNGGFGGNGFVGNSFNGANKKADSTGDETKQLSGGGAPSNGPGGILATSPAGPPSQPPGSGALTPPTSVLPLNNDNLAFPADQQKILEDKLKNTAEWAERQTKLSQDRNRTQAEKPLREFTGEAKEKAGAVRIARKNDRSADRSQGDADRLLGEVKSGEGATPQAESPAEPKQPPFDHLAVVRLGPLRPHWLTSTTGIERLFLLRSVTVDQRVEYQGVVADWPALQNTLTTLVTDLFPQAKLVPVHENEESPPERTMTTLPVRLDTGEDPACVNCGWTPLRFGLVIAWAAAVLAIVATAIGGRAVLVTSGRRVRFASAVTHELRTPLTALQLHLDLLNSGLITDEAKKAEYLATLAAEADRLNRLVENVLDFARLEKPAAVANARPVPVDDLLDATRHTWADRLRSEEFDLIVDSTTPPGQTIVADPRVMEQVLGNLIDNARKYAKSATDRRIWVRALPAARGRVAVEVEDRGPGVPANERRAIFRPFIRGSGTTDTGGAGLGLNLAREWAELFGGSLVYRPATGGSGACFRLELPGG